MTKKEMIEEVHKALRKDGIEVPKRVTTRAVELTFDTVRKGIKKDKRLQIPRFGTFDVRQRKARKGYNPQTGMSIKIKARKAVRFRPSSVFRKTL